MAKIQQYQQGQIASSRVGVPDLGNAAGALATASAGIAAAQGATGLRTGAAFAAEQTQVAQQNTQFAVQQNQIAMHGLTQNIYALQQAHNDRVRQDMAVQKAQQDALDNVSAARLKMDLGIKVGELQSKAKEMFKDNPDAAPGWFKEQSEIELERLVRGAAYNDNVKSKAMAATYGDVESNAKGLNDWKFSQRTANEIERAGQDAERLSVLPDNNKTVLGLHEQLDQVEWARKNIWSGALGEAAANKLAAKTTKEATANLLSHMAETNPRELIDRVKDGQFDHFGLNEKEKQGFLKDAEQQLRAQQAIQKDQEEKAKVTVDHKILGVAFKSNLDPRDPNFVAASITARSELREMYKQVDKDPPSAANLAIKKEIQAAIDKQDAQIEKAHTLAHAEESRKERMENKADRVAAAKARDEDKAERAKEKAEKQAAIAKYESPEARNTRVKLSEALHRVRDPEGLTKNLKHGNVEKGAGFAPLSDHEQFELVREATAQLKAAHGKGYLNKPGQSDRYYEDNLALLNAMTERLQNKGGMIAPTSTGRTQMEKFYAAKLQAPPKVVLDTFGDRPETQQKYHGIIDSEVQKFRAQTHRDPTAEEIQKYIHGVAQRKMLAGK